MQMVQAARAVVFDLDGTLLNTLPDIAHSMNLALADLGHAKHELSAYNTLVGEGLKRLAELALPPGLGNDPVVVESCIKRFRQHYAVECEERSRPYPGIEAMLDELVKRDLPLAIISNKPHDFVVRIATNLLPRWRFDPLLGARAEVPKKPDPTALLEVADALSLPPSACLFVGDTGIDMAAAKAAAMVGVGVLWGFRDHDELVEHGAVHVIDKPSELIELAGA